MKLEEMVGKRMTEAQFDEAAGEKDACYRKVKARYDVWPSAYASGALVKCRKVGAANWGNKSKKEGVNEKKGDFLDSLFPKAKVDKAVKIAKSMGGNMSGAVKKIEKMFKGMSKHTKVKDALQQANEGLDNLKALPKDLKKSIKKKRNEGLADKISKNLSKYNKRAKKSRDTMKKYAKVKKKESVDEARGTCWVGYQQKGMKDKGGKMVPNCVKEITEIFYEVDGKGYGYTLEYINDGKLNEAEYQGRKVKLGKPMQGDTKKFKVYVKNPKGNVVKVNFGQGGDAKGGTMKIRKSNPKARKSFRARHNCDNPGPRHKARYWSCRKW